MVDTQQERNIIDFGFLDRGIKLPITNREKEVLTYLAQGYTNKQISKFLNLSYSTVRNHISSIFIKLQVANRSQATAVAIYSGLFKPKTDIE